MPSGKVRDTISKKYLPASFFNDLQGIDRTKRLMLALPIPYGKNIMKPWGYDRSIIDDDWVVPDEKAILALLQSMRSLKYCTYKEACEWLVNVTGRPITYEGYRKLLKLRPPLDIVINHTISEREEMLNNYERLPESLRGRASVQQEKEEDTSELYAQAKKLFNNT